MRVDPANFGCAFNAGVAFLSKNYVKNSEKWFSLAMKLHTESQDSKNKARLGLAISKMKLGLHQECIDLILSRNETDGSLPSSKRSSLVGSSMMRRGKAGFKSSNSSEHLDLHKKKKLVRYVDLKIED